LSSEDEEIEGSGYEAEEFVFKASKQADQAKVASPYFIF